MWDFILCKYIIECGIFSPKSLKCFHIVLKIGYTTFSTLAMILLLCLSVVLPLIITGFHRSYCSCDLLALFLMTTLCLLTLGGWLPSVPKLSEVNRHLHFILCCTSVWGGGGGRETRTNPINNNEKQWEGKKRFLLNGDSRLEDTVLLSDWSTWSQSLLGYYREVLKPCVRKHDYIPVTGRETKGG